MSEQKLETRGIRVTFPASWLAEDDGEDVSLHRSPQGGAITISTYRHSDPQGNADAVEKCRRFVANLGSDVACVRGAVSEATAELTDSSGERWIIRTVARRNRFALVTYNSRLLNPAEESEARRILGSIELVG